MENEYDRLEAVLVHRPGLEIDRLTHENMRQFLFEDVPYLRRMQAEHDAFVEQLRGFGVNVYYLHDLVRDLVRDDSTRGDLVRRVCEAAGAPALTSELSELRYWDHDALVVALFAGITAAEYAQVSGRRLDGRHGDEEFVLPPAPNAYFSRDPAVVVRDACISCKMHYRERVRESIIVRAVIENHPEFQDNVMTYGGTEEPTEDRPYTIEGGDVIVLSPEAVLVGASERTRSETIELLADKCFRVGHVKRVYELPIPAERAFMHLDTVFTVVDRGMVLWFSPVMSHVKYIHRYEPLGERGERLARRVSEERPFLEILRDEFGCDVTVIDTAGGRKQFAAREQRTDATNALAIAPRHVVTYERNERTITALEAHGVTCTRIFDSELVRGLGGPRCMTMPLRRGKG